MNSISGSYHRLAKSQLGTTQRTLIMFKPDAVALGQCVRGLRHLALKLQQNGVNFRYVAPQLLAATPEIINTLYTEHVGKSWYEKRHLPFMTGNHPDPTVKQAPLFTMILEADARIGNLCQILRQDHVIGPTNPERVLGELEASEQRSQRIMQSIRYLLTLGSGARIYLLHRKDNSPLYNRLHSSATLDEAKLELLATYGTLQELKDFYTEETLSTLLADWKPQGIPIPKKTINLPFWRSYQENQGLALLEQIIQAGFNYKDFGENELRRLIFESNQFIPILQQLDRNFAVNLRKRIIQPITFERFDHPKPPAVLIGISGPPGSGKTTIANALMEKLGLKSATHVTSYGEEAKAPVGEEFLYLPEELFMEMLAQAELVGASQFREWRKYYSVLRSSLDELSLRGGTALLVCGANTLATVRKHLKGSNVIFRTIFVSPPSLAETRVRHEKRARPGDEKRYEKLESVGQRILDRAKEFDYVVVNDDLETAVAQAVQYVEKSIAGKVPQTAMLPEATTTPQQFLIEYLCRSLFKNLRETRNQIQAASLEDIQRSVRDLYEEKLKRFLAEIRKEIRNLPHLSKTDAAAIENITDHSLEVFASALLAAQPAQTVLQTSDSLGRLATHGSPQRVTRNLSKIRRLSESIPQEDRDVLAILHDIGKAKEFFNHPVYSGELIERNNLMDGFSSIPPERKSMIKMTIKHHLAIGCLAFSIHSLATTRNILADPEVKDVLTDPDGSINLYRAKTFLNYLLYITIADVAARPGKRGLRNLITEAYFRWHSRIYRFAVENQVNYENFLTALVSNAAKYNFERLSGKAASVDIEMDLKEDWSFYDNIVRRARDRAFREGIFSRADWKFLLNNLQYITDEWYTPLSFLARVDSKAEQVLDHIPEEMNVNYLKLLIFSLRIASKNIPDFGPDQSFALAFTGASGNYLTKMSSMKSCAVELDRIMRKAEGFIRKGEELYFTDKEGKKIANQKITLSLNSPESLLTINLNNLP